MVLLENCLDFRSEGPDSSARGRRIVTVADLSTLSVGRFLARLNGPEELAAVQAFNARRDILAKVEALQVPFTTEPEAYAGWGYWLFYEAGTSLPQGRECWGYEAKGDIYEFLSSYRERPFTLVANKPAPLALAAAFHCVHGVTRAEFDELLKERDFEWAADRLRWRGLDLSLQQIRHFRARQLKAIVVDRLPDPFQEL